MRNKFSLIALLAIGLTSIGFWVGCSKKEQQIVCSTCKPVRPESIRDITITGQSFSVGVYKQNTSRSLLLARIQNETNVTAASFQTILNDLSKNKAFENTLNDKYVPVNYNVFIDKDVRQNEKIEVGDIRAISLITYKNYGLYHFLFLKNDAGELILRSEYSLSTDGLNVKDQYSLFTSLFSEESKTTLFTLISTVTPSYEEVMNRIKTENELRDFLKNQLAVMSASKLYPGDSSKCADPCPPLQDQPAECKAIIGGYGCIETEDHCLARAIAREDDHLSDFLSMKDTLYLMRDSILANSTHGQEIIDNYYIAGKYISQNLNQVDVSSLYDFVCLLYSKLPTLMSCESAEIETVLITTTTKNDLLAEIDGLRSISSETEWQDCLDWMESMINEFTNSSANEIWAYINS